MQDLNDKVTGNELTAAEWNEIPSEIQNAITDSGQTLSSGDLTQLSKAIGGYSKATKALAAAITPVAGKTMFVESSDGGLFKAVTGAAAATYSDNGGSYCGTQFIPTGGDGSAAWVRVDGGYNVGLGYNPLWFGLVDGLATSDTSGAAVNTAAMKTAISVAAVTGSSIEAPIGEFVVALDSTTVSKDTYTSIGCAIELVSWVDIKGQGMATLGGSATGTRFTLADGQDCHVFGNFENTTNGLSGCWLDKFTVNGNRTNNSTSGSGIFIGSVFTGTGFGLIKVGYTREKGVYIYATSTPIWMDGLFTGSTGEEGFYLNGASSAACNIFNLQCDNAGLNSGGEGALTVGVGSTENTNITIFNFRYEAILGTEPTATTLGIQLNALAGATVNIISAYGFISGGSGADFIKVTTSTGRVNIQSTTCNSAYTNIFNDAVSGRTIAQSTSGIQNMMESSDLWQSAIFRNKSGANITTIKQNSSGALHINNSADGGNSNDVAIYGPSKLSTNFDDTSSTGTSRGRAATEQAQISPRGGSGNSPIIISGVGSPEGQETAAIGSMYMRNDGGTGTSVYIKESGTGNTGWVAK